jgi:hypothetical protein
MTQSESASHPSSESTLHVRRGRPEDALAVDRRLLLAHGLPEADAAIVAEWPVNADLRGSTRMARSSCRSIWRA